MSEVSVNSPEMQCRILAFAYSHTNKQVFEQFMTVDPEIHEQTISDKRVRSIYDVFRLFYARNKSLPTLSMFNSFKTDVEAYQNILRQLDDLGKANLRRLEKLVYEPISESDHNELLLRYKEFCVLNNTSMNNHLQMTAYANKKPDEDVLKLFKKYNSDTASYLSRLERLLDPEDEDSVFLYDETDLDNLENKQGVVSGVTPACNIYHEGYTAVRSGPKGFKTLVTINACQSYVASDGFDILLLDLENGTSNYKVRSYQSMLGLPSYCIIGKKFYDASLIREEIERYSPLYLYQEGDVVWEYTYFFEKGTGAKGFRVGKDAVHHINVKFYQALVDNPRMILDIQGFESTDWKVVDVPLDPSGWLSTKDELDRVKKEQRAAGAGQMKIEYIRDASPSQIHQKIEEAIHRNDGKFEGFFEDEYSRVVAIDWISLMKPDTHSSHISERTNNIYYGLKDIRNDFKVSMIGIEGTTKKDHFQEKFPNPIDASAKGSSEVDYNVVSSFGIYGCKDEIDSGVRRFHKIVDRYKAADGSTMSYFGVDPRNQRIQTISEAQHRALCPKFWEGQETSEDLEDMDITY